MQSHYKGAAAALLALLLAVCTTGSQGSAAAPAVPALNASQLIATASDQSLTAQQFVELAVSAAGPGIPVNSSAQLWQALQSADKSAGVVSVVLQGDVTLDSKNWTKVLVPAGQVVVIRSQLHAEGLNMSSGPDALMRAGAPTLNFGQVAEALVIEDGALLVLQGLVLNNQAFTGAWMAAGLARGADAEPGNLGTNPGIISRAGSKLAHRWMYINYWMPTCAADVVAGNVYRGSVLLKSVSANASLVMLNTTAYALMGSASPDVPLLLPNGTSPGKVHVDAADTVYNCQTDPTGNDTLAVSPSGGNGRSGGPAAWVWVLVGLAGLAVVSTVAAVLLFRRRRLRRSRAAAKAALPGGLPSSALVVVGQADPDSLGSKPTASPRQSSGDKVKDEDLEMASSGPEGGVLQEVWGSRLGGAAEGLTLIEPLDRGGFAVVWKARWKGIIVAAKLIEHSLSEADSVAARAEAALSASVAHPNVVSTYAVHTVSLAELDRLQQEAEQPVAGQPRRSGDCAAAGPGATLIVQELCSCSVEMCMQEGKLLYLPDGSPDQVAVLRMLLDAAQGLEYLASLGVVHGDVKAANVLISTGCGTKRGWQAKIADLGLSRMLPHNAVRHVCSRLSRPHLLSPAAQLSVRRPWAKVLTRVHAPALHQGTSLAPACHYSALPCRALPLLPQSCLDGRQQTGTVAYMAPEVVSCGRITRAADVYAFGILMYEVWARCRAWAGLSMAQLSFEVVVRQGRPPVPPGCPPGYSSLMEQCWAQTPEDRPTFQTVLQSLQALLRTLLQPAGTKSQQARFAAAAVHPALERASR
ncbi:hypothetical protein ABPG77_006733 [Micractinium sp. CCAP 211/92]